LTKGIAHQKGSKRLLLVTLKEILERGKNNEENSDYCSDENGGKILCFVSKNTYRISVAGEYGLNEPSAKCGPMRNVLLAFPGDMFFPTASRMYQMKISEVLWTYISVPRFIF
jgi:hypothetical protein